MSLFLSVFIIMLIVIIIMSVGYIFQKKTIQGSCGGISSLGLDKVCDCDEPCERRKKHLAKTRLQEPLIAHFILSDKNSHNDS
jgi:hypothetical protein